MHDRLNPVRRGAVLLVTGLLATLGLIATGSPASAGPIACNNMNSFTLVFRTGGDDLRGNSEVMPYLTTRFGDVELGHFNGGFGNNSTSTKVVGLANLNWTVNSCDVTGLKLRMVSHNGAFQTDDNWNMDAVTMYGYGNNGAYSYYFNASGAPLKRFTGSSQWWSMLG
ncbi:hypothetical protein ACFRMN_30250 [Streptomyces sp. NPDC056835]|uniref:hypothetical protein n=1 Tax=Streptomyces sp. NPDC056835 TaxID=3345956 RepID=UPI00368067C9